MRRAWPLALLALFVIAALWSRPRGSATSPPSARTRETALPNIQEPIALSTAKADRASTPAAPDQTALERPDGDHVPRFLRWLPRHQNADGSWGDGLTSIDGVLVGKTGLTGLVLLSFMGAGYSHLSKDAYDEFTMGPVVRGGLRALMDDQREDGLFRSSRSGLDHALAALALSEAFGMTGSQQFKERAQRSIDALVSAQIQDGSWGDGPTTFWAADALKSADLGELAVPRAAYEQLRAHYDRRGVSDAREMLARISIDKKKQAAAGWMSATPTTGWPLHEIYAHSRGIFQFDGPAGPLWKNWNEPFKTAVLGRPIPDGLNDRILHESLSALCLEVYYRYANSFGAR